METKNTKIEQTETEKAQVVEIFTSASGSWTIVVTRPDGQTCLVASGQAWEDITEELPAKGEPA